MSEWRLDSIHVRDFKSFRGEHEIGPFSDFSGIVGPNGSGKSNVLDSLAFALFLDLSPRSTNYIHKTDIYQADSCSVRVTLASDDEKKAFERQIDDTEHYLIDGEETTEKEYVEAIQSLGIIPLAFLKQSEIDEIARKTPLELTQLFEQMSGSAEYADKYEELRIQLQNAQEELKSLDKMKRSALSEKKHVSTRKIEADKFNELAQKEEDILIESSLFQLFHANNQYNEAIDNCSNLIGDQTRLATEESNLKTKLLQKQQISNKTHEELLQHDQLLNEKQQLNREANAQYLKLDETKKRLEVRYETAVQNIKNNENASVESKKRLQKMKAELVQCENELSGLPHVQELENEISEFNDLREQASNQFSDLTEAIRRAIKERDEKQKDLNEIHVQKDQAKITKQRQRDSIQKNQELKSMAEKRKNLLNDEIKSNDAKLKQMKNELDQKLKKQHEQTTLLKEKDKRYEDIRRVHGTNKKAERIKKAIINMKRFIPGIYGKFSDLCHASHQKYEIALKVGCGGYVDAIIVKNKEVGARVIEYLREQGVGRADVLPLEDLITSENTHAPPDGMKLSKYVEKQNVKGIDQAINYVCGNIYVYKSLEEANRIAFRYNVSCVTLDGSFVDPKGTLTGGTVKETVWSGNLDELAEERANLEKELSILGDQIEKLKREIEDLEEQSLPLKPQRDHLIAQIADLEERDKKLQSSLRTAMRDFKSKKTAINAAEKELEKAADALKQVDMKKYEIDKSIFADFCKRTGVEDIKQFEITRLQQYEDRYSRRLELESKIAQLKSYISMEEKSNTVDKAQAYEETKNQLKSQLEEVTAEYEIYIQKKKEYAEEIEKLKKERNTKLDEEDSNKSELKDLRKQHQEITEQLESINEEINAAEHQKSVAKQVLSTVFQNCRLANVKLPRLSEDDDDTEPADTPSSMTQEDQDLNNVKSIDFKSLKPAHRAYLRPEQFKEKVKKYEDSLAEIRKELSNIRPDLKSGTRIQNVENEIQKFVSRQSEQKALVAKTKKDFAEVKQKRIDSFMKLYDAIDQKIDSIYKMLTRVRNSDNRSGTAYLTLEDTEEPYLGGIKYTAMPPHKRFRDLEQLSGGEKAIASLALVISLQMHIGAPFVLMDEPDSSLDLNNLRSAASALREMSKNSQIICVSLRDKFFSFSESLFGIYKENSEQSSGLVTLSIKKFVENNLTMEPLDE